jgi:hypothetical protein
MRKRPFANVSGVDSGRFSGRLHGLARYCAKWRRGFAQAWPIVRVATQKGRVASISADRRRDIRAMAKQSKQEIEIESHASDCADSI